MPAIMALDTLKSHNHSGDFHFHGYSWCVRSLGVIRNNEFKIPDYACELILAYAECLHRKNPPDDLTIESAIEYNPEVAEGAEILIDDYIRSAAEEISKLNKDIDYDRFEDPCGPAALIRVDMVTDDEEYSQIGYRCMNCNMVYDDGYRKI